MEVRLATKDDIPGMMNMCEDFIEESDLPYTYNFHESWKTLFLHIHAEEGISIVALQDGIYAGFLIGVMDKDFTNEYSAYINKLYVRKEFRGTPVARQMVDIFDLEADDAVVIYTSATAKMGGKVEKMYVNLFKKFGFEPLGQTLVKYNVKI